MSRARWPAAGWGASAGCTAGDVNVSAVLLVIALVGRTRSRTTGDVRDGGPTRAHRGRCLPLAVFHGPADRTDLGRQRDGRGIWRPDGEVTSPWSCRRESHRPISTQAFGADHATAGVILTGVAFEGGLRGTRFAGPGVVFAVVALVLFAMMAITTDIALESAGWLQVLLISRLRSRPVSRSSWSRQSRWPRAAPERVGARRRRRRTGTVVAVGTSWPAIVVAGILDVLGLVSFAIGLESAPTWLVGLASSFGPAVTILVAVALLGERLKPIQWVGLAGVAVGMIAIALP